MHQEFFSMNCTAKNKYILLVHTENARKKNAIDKYTTKCAQFFLSSFEKIYCVVSCCYERYVIIWGIFVVIVVVDRMNFTTNLSNQPFNLNCVNRFLLNEKYLEPKKKEKKTTPSSLVR